nr:MAG TPA: Alginate and motility regulator [Caudoviricetes sp.]
MPTDAQKRTRNKWDAENMSVISCKLKREIAENFKTAARANGTTPNELIRGWINDYLNDRKEGKT